MKFLLLTKTYTEFITNNKNDTLGAQTESAYDVLNQIYSLLLYIGAFGLAIGILLVAISFMNGTAIERVNGKKRLTELCLVGIVMFSLGSLLTIFYEITLLFL